MARWVFLSLAAISTANAQTIVINELMYHPLQPQFAAEPLGEEFVELYNRGATNVNLNGWRFNKGISFTFTNIILPAGGYLVVSPDTNTFLSHYGAIPGAILVGNWTGTLGNNGETIELKDAAGDVVDSIPYATEGDWAIRQRGPLDLNHRGWEWYCESDGAGKSMERRNPALPGDSGQNWRFSAVANGTPGRANAALTNNVAPFILGLAHSPVVPRSTQSVSVTARILDEVTTGLAVTLFYSINPASSPATFSSTNMLDDGMHGDGVANDGVYGAILPAQANNTIVEFYVQAADSGGRASTWPGPAIAAADTTGPVGQVVNALYQVDNDPQNDFGVLTPSQPVLKLIMTAAEATELASIPGGSSLQGPNSQMNGTFIATDGISTEVRYRCGFRNRGHGSRTANPPNYRINVPNEQLWKNQAALNANAVNTPAQVLGATIAKKAGLAGTDSRAAQVRVNNQNRASTGTGMLSSYALNEEIGTEWAAQHFPLDSGGNAYRVLRDIAPPDWAYRGPLASSYTNTYYKADNNSAYDWSDLIQVHRIVGSNDLFTTANVRQVANVEEWCRYYAIMALYGNTETSPNTGHNDDYFMYRGVNDPRFLLMYYDNDSVLSSTYWGAQSSLNIFGAEANNGMGAMTARFLEWPDFKPIYYATFQQLLNSTFSQPEFDAIVDEVMNTFPSGSNRENVRSSVKSYMTSRRATAQSLINGFVPPATNNPVATISGEPRALTPFTTATLTVGGAGITHYKWKLNNGAYSAEASVATILSLSGLANGSTNAVYVVGRNSAGIYQDTTNPTVSKTWVVKTSTPKVRLNELLARNDSAVNHSGTFPDIIELLNEGATTIDLSGLRLTDDAATPDTYTFPANTMLAGGGYLVLYANNPDATPGIHLGFSLNQDGDSVYLFDRATNGNVLLDSVTFGVQLANKSIGRFADGDWKLCQPTSGATNTAQATGSAATLKINEWLAASGALPFVDDFIEIYNPDPLPVAMGGMYLTDEPIGAPALHRIADLSFVAGGGFLSFIADGNDGAGANHLNFQLDADIGEIGLLDALLNKIDCVSYGPQRAGITMGRCPDGAVTNIVILNFPTPGVGNSCPTPPPAPITVTLLNYNNVWRYESNNFDGVSWMAPGFNDSAWPSGPGVHGRSNGSAIPEPLLTPMALGKTTYVFRTSFSVPTNANFTAVQFTHIIDDGAIVYLNGTEVYRYNMPAGPVNNATLASMSINGPPTYAGPVSLPVGSLIAGTNQIAVEVHQSLISSSDFYMGLKLDGVIVTNSPGSAGVLINEVFARNGTVVEPDGTTPDWVEIYNPAQSAVDLGDASLSDSTLNPRRWVFPVPTILPAQSYYTVRFDSGTPVSSTNTGFGLKSSGDSVYLFKKPADGGGVLDQINFGIQLEDFSIGRVPSGSTNWQLTIPSARAANTAAPTNDASGLKINEWMAQPLTGDDWFEVYNSAAQPVNLGGLWLSDILANASSRQQFRIQNLSFIGTATNAFIRFWADNNLSAGADHVSFKLAAMGEEIGVSYADGTLINGVNFSQQDPGVSEGYLPDGSTNKVKFPTTASPGEGNYLLLTGIFINEALAHTDLPLEDAIELINTNGAGVNLGGWYLSDSKSNLKKFTVANGTIIAPGLFKVFYEYQFNDVNFPLASFSLSSSKGDQVYLSQATNGVLTGYRAVAKFGPSANGVSFGRYVNSQGEADYVAMSALSFGTAVTAQSPTNQITVFRTGAGATNPYPKVGPVIINEIMYHPPDIIMPGVSTNDNTVEEFIELKNISALTVPLYDTAHSTNGWRLRDAVDFTFTSAHSIPPGGHLIVVSFNPVTNAAALAQFRAKYGSNYVLAGPWSGKLDNSSESVELVRPDNPQPDGDVPQILVEKVVYQDKAPWSTNADGLGQSLQRLSASGYANDVTNWLAAVPALGPFGDSDGDGMPDDWEMANGLNKNFAGDAGLDPDGDGMTNLQEYLAGTNPQSNASVLRLAATLNSGGVDLTFTAVAGRTYTILYANSMPGGGNWQWLTDVPAQGVTGAFIVHDVSNQTGVQRYYRILTPAQQ